MSCASDYKWPCAYQGSTEFYAVDLGPYLTQEGDTLSDITWVVPNGLTKVAEEVINNIAYIKLSAVLLGEHVVRMTMTSLDGTQQSTTRAKIKLHVQEF